MIALLQILGAVTCLIGSFVGDDSLGLRGVALVVVGILYEIRDAVKKGGRP